jgi:hypothetical protein
LGAPKTGASLSIGPRFTLYLLRHFDTIFTLFKSLNDLQKDAVAIASAKHFLWPYKKTQLKQERIQYLYKANKLKLNHMKTLFLFVLIATSSVTGYSQIDCKPYVPAEKGTVWEITNYNAKDKITGRIVYELVDKVENGNEITFTVKSTLYDKNDEEIYNNTFEAKCVDGKFQFDMTYRMDGGALQSYQDMDIEVDATEFEIPDIDASPGTQLEDSQLVVSIASTAGINLNMTVLITDRLVESKENVTTPAGSFDCIVLTQNISTKMLLNVKSSSKEWYSENIGMVRSESYNKRGKLTGYSELTKLEL